jgi:hypothetical protein
MNPKEISGSFTTQFETTFIFRQILQKVFPKGIRRPMVAQMHHWRIMGNRLKPVASIAIRTRSASRFK